MLEQAVLLKLSPQNLAESTTSQLRQEYLAYQSLFQAQSSSGQKFLREQAATISDAITNRATSIHFCLPEHLVCPSIMDCSGVDEMLPREALEQKVGGFLDRLTHRDLTMALADRLAELEKSHLHAVSASSGLVRYSVAMHLIYHMLPAGRAVSYASPKDGDIPNQPVQNSLSKDLESALSITSRDEEINGEPGQIPVPDRSFAQRFFMPQWVAFDDQDRLLVADIQAAISLIESTRRYLCIINTGVCLAPYMVVDEEFQARRYGILGQFVNQGRALARYQAKVICQTIKRQADLHQLDRGLSLSLPYFNDSTLMIEHYNFDVIPVGMVMFVPAFVVLAVRDQAAKVVQDTRLNRTSRLNLLQGLYILEKAFLR